MTAMALTDQFTWNSQAKVRFRDQVIASSDVICHPPTCVNDHGLCQIVTDREPAEALRKIFACISERREFLMTGSDGQTFDRNLPGPNNPFAFQVLTAGSEGRPKRIRRSQSSWIASFEINKTFWLIGPQDMVAILGQLSHTLSSFAAFEALHSGADVLLLSGLSPRLQLEQIGQHEATVLYATPTQIRLLISISARIADAPYPAVKLLLTGGAKLDAAVRGQAQCLFPNAEIIEFYGSTETSFISVSDHSCPSESVGRPYPGVEISIRNSAGISVPVGESGHLWVRSPYLAMDLVPEHDLTGPEQSSYWQTGEIGRFDSAGYLYLLGRRDRMIRVAERSLHPEAVETFLFTQQGVLEAAIIAVPDQLRGASAHAVVLKDCTAKSDEELLKACRERFGTGSSPRTLRSISVWPRLPSGKTDLIELDSIFGNEGCQSKRI